MLDCVIVGNGILGLALAFRLKNDHPSLKVAVVGPAARRGSATMAAGAMLNVWAELADGQFEDPYLAQRFELPLRGMGAWRGFADEIVGVTGGRIDIGWGTYAINTPMSAPWGDRTWAYFVKSLKEKGVDHEIMEPLEIPFLAPAQHSRPLAAARLPDGRVSPEQILGELEKALDILGVECLDDEVVWLETDGVRRVHLASGLVLDTDKAVLANGSFAQALIDQVPALRYETPRLVWGNGAALELTFPEWIPRGEPNHPLWDMDCVVRSLNPIGACGLHVVPRGGAKFYVGASSAVLYEREWEPRAHAVGFLLNDVVHEINRKFAWSTVRLVGCGFRPVCVDTFPLLGESSVSGVWFLNGMKRDGLTSAPYLVQELSREMTVGTSALPLAFRPSRKLIPYKTRATAIDEAVLFSINGERQHDLHLPPWADESYAAHRRDEISKVYEKRAIGDFAIHPEVIHLFDNDAYFAGITHSIPK